MNFCNKLITYSWLTHLEYTFLMLAISLGYITRDSGCCSFSHPRNWNWKNTRSESWVSSKYKYDKRREPCRKCRIRRNPSTKIVILEAQVSLSLVFGSESTNRDKGSNAFLSVICVFTLQFFIILVRRIFRKCHIIILTSIPSGVSDIHRHCWKSVNIKNIPKWPGKIQRLVGSC